MSGFRILDVGFRTRRVAWCMISNTEGFILHRVSNSLNSIFKGGDMKDYIGDYYRGYQREYSEFRLRLMWSNPIDSVKTQQPRDVGLRI